MDEEAFPSQPDVQHNQPCSGKIAAKLANKSTSVRLYCRGSVGQGRENERRAPIENRLNGAAAVQKMPAQKAGEGSSAGKSHPDLFSDPSRGRWVGCVGHTRWCRYAHHRLKSATPSESIKGRKMARRLTQTAQNDPAPSASGAAKKTYGDLARFSSWSK